MTTHNVSFGLGTKKRNFTSHADELELFYHVSRLFQPTFESQTTLRRTKVYSQSRLVTDDPTMSEAARARLKLEEQTVLYLKEADWVENRVLHPSITPEQELRTAALNRFGLDHGVDEVLSVETNFVERDDIEFVRCSFLDTGLHS
jgi:hypothetical protein